jgi:hypothetical protein
MPAVHVVLALESEIKDDVALTALLNDGYPRSVVTYVALAYGEWEAIERKCGLRHERGSGFRLPGFRGYIRFYDTEVNEIPYLIIGPGGVYEPLVEMKEITDQIPRTMLPLRPEPSAHVAEVSAPAPPEWFDRLRATSPTRRMMNEDGGVMKLGNGDGHTTYYCGEFKGPTSFIHLSSDFPHPPDHKCGPNNGMQCIACKVVQDVEFISRITQPNCHTKFTKLFGAWTLGINVPMEAKFIEIEDVIYVCNGRLNSNQASKTIFFTALEMIEAVCNSAKLRLDHTSFEITIGGASCIFEIMDPRTRREMTIRIKCKKQQTIDENIREYNNVHTACSFDVEYRKAVRDS